MGRRSALFWAVVVVAVLGAVVYLPAYLARSMTGPGEPVSFLSRPLDGWHFVLDAVSALPDARAGSPAAARRIALREFGNGRVQLVRVDLLYLPDRSLDLRTRQGTRSVATKARLVWKVSGRTAPGGPLRTIGLIDLATGTVIYDVRHESVLAR
jgi:hypothetical protein